MKIGTLTWENNFEDILEIYEMVDSKFEDIDSIAVINAVYSNFHALANLADHKVLKKIGDLIIDITWVIESGDLTYHAIAEVLTRLISEKGWTIDQLLENPEIVCSIFSEGFNYLCDSLRDDVQNYSLPTFQEAKSDEYYAEEYDEEDEIEDPIEFSLLDDDLPFYPSDDELEELDDEEFYDDEMYTWDKDADSIIDVCEDIYDNVVDERDMRIVFDTYEALQGFVDREQLKKLLCYVDEIEANDVTGMISTKTIAGWIGEYLQKTAMDVDDILKHHRLDLFEHLQDKYNKFAMVLIPLLEQD